MRLQDRGGPVIAPRAELRRGPGCEETFVRAPVAGGGEPAHTRAVPIRRVVVIGAGLAGLACARALAAAGASVRLFDKGRAPGGRLATRRAEAAGVPLQFDHGAQHLRIEGPALASLLAELGARPWPDADRVVGVPGMSTLARGLAAGLSLTTGRHVVALAGGPGDWRVRHADAARVRAGAPVEPEIAEEGGFDAAVITAPAPQAIPLVAPHAPELAAALAAVRYAPCLAVMAAFPGRLALPDTIQPKEGPIGWAARDSAKPGRAAERECWVVHATPAWSREHFDEPPAAVIAALLAALGAPHDVPPIHAEMHRWRYALVEAPLGAPCLWDPARQLGVAGDGCLAARAEAAWDSGVALARAIAGDAAPAA